jgi:hypothetical protein
MATNPILAALAGVNTNALETPYGLGLQGLAVAAPKMFNPYASTGQSLGVALGTGLTSALLAYQARKQADEENMAMQPLILQALSAKNPEDVLKVTSAPGGGKLRDFAVQTYLSKLEKQQAQEAAAEERKADLAKALLGSPYLNRQEALTLAGISPEVTPLPTTELGATAATKLETPQVSSPTERPIINYVSPEERANLSPYELKQREAEVSDQKYRAEQWDKAEERKSTKTKSDEEFKAAQQEKTDTKIINLRKDIDSDPITKAYIESKTAFKAARQLAERDSIPATIALKKIAERVFNPGNQVTMQELGSYNSIMPIFEKYPQLLSSQLTGKSNLSPEARQELVAAAEIFIDSLGKSYNEKAKNQFDYAASKGWTSNLKDIAPVDLHVSRSEAIKGIQAIQQRLERNKELIASGKPGMSAATKSAIEAEYASLKGQL